MTKKQKKILDKLEFALANFVFDGKKELANIWGPIVEAMQKSEFVWAIILAEEADIPKRLVEYIRRSFHVKKVV